MLRVEITRGPNSISRHEVTGDEGAVFLLSCYRVVARGQGEERMRRKHWKREGWKGKEEIMEIKGRNTKERCILLAYRE